MDQESQRPEIEFRTMRHEDIVSLQNIFNKIRRTDIIPGIKKVSDRLVKSDFLHCLAEQNFCEVAVANGKPVGFIMGRYDPSFSKIKTIARRLNAYVNDLSVRCSKQGREGLRFLKQTLRMDSALLHKAGSHFDGQIVFIAVCPSMRGLGIGQRLFDDFKNYMDSQGAYQFYGFSDDDNTNRFYAENGFRRLCREASYNKHHPDCSNGCCLYEYNLKNPVRRNARVIQRDMPEDIRQTA